MFSLYFADAAAGEAMRVGGVTDVQAPASASTATAQAQGVCAAAEPPPAEPAASDSAAAAGGTAGAADGGCHVGVQDEEEGRWCGATLVICPLVAVIQWSQEIARFTDPGSVKARKSKGAA